MRGLAALSRRFASPRLLTVNEDEGFTPTKVAFGERCDKEPLDGLVVVACRLLLLLSPCHEVLARETRRRDVKPPEFKRVTITQPNSQEPTRLVSCLHIRL
jgi:hypothetical protein